MRWLPLLLLLSACPQDIDAAQFTPGDGGVWVGGPDGGQFVANEETKTEGYRNSPPLPPPEKICMLWIGDYNDMSDYPKGVGIWIHDIRDKRFLGEPNTDGNVQGNDDAQLRYTFQKPGSQPGTDLISFNLRFEFITAVTQPAKDGVPWPDAYFLSGVDVQGMDYPKCLQWQYRETPEFHSERCDWCAGFSQFDLCSEIDPRDCYKRQ